MNRATLSLTNLSQGTAYTFAGHLDDGCSVAFDTASFTTPGVRLSTAALSVPEGGSANYTAVLTAATATAVTVAVGSQSGGDGDLSASPTTLNFSTTNWSTAQTVTVSAAEDSDNAAGNKTFTHTVTSTGADYSGASGAILTATGAENEVYLSVRAVEATNVSLTLNNQTAQWWVKETSPSNGSCINVAAGVTTRNFFSLSPGTSYTYKAYSDNTCATELDSASFLTKPGQVAGVTATPKDAALDVAWTAQTGAVTGYRVQWKSGSESYGADRKATVAAGTSHSITGLTNATAYTVRVTAYNATGDGAASADVTGTPAKPAATAPAAPDAPSVALIGGKMRLSWKAPDDGGAAITGYKYAKKVGALSFETNYTAIPNSATLESYTFTSGLTDGIAYRFKVLAVNSLGNGAASAQSEEVTPNAVMLASSNVTFSAATLTIANHDGPWYHKHTIPGTGGTYTAVPAGVSTASLTELAASTSYTFAAYSDSGCSTALATAAAFTTTAATGTKTLTASNVKATQLTLTAANHSGRWYYKHTTPTGGICTNVENVTTAVATGLKPSTAYVFTAYSDNTCSTSIATAASVSTNAVSAPEAPAKSAVAAGNGRVALSWNPPYNGGDPITRYE